MNALRIAFAGTPEFALPSLDRLIRSPHQIVGVLTQPDRPKGRGRQLAASAVKVAAQAAGFAVYQPESLETESDGAPLAAWQPDLLIVIAYGLILPKAILGLPRLGCLNVHASLLPRWRGAAPIQRAVLAGDSVTGITIMRMEAGLDTGPVILQRPTAIFPDDTAGSLHDRLAALGGDALLEALEDGGAQLKGTPQPSDGVTYAAKIQKGEGVIDWSQDALTIERRVRAFNPWPVAETRLGGEQLRIYGARALGEKPAAEAGNAAPPGEAAEARDAVRAGDQGVVLAISESGVVVACGSGMLVLTEVQRAGRRRIRAAELARTSNLVGRRLG